MFNAKLEEGKVNQSSIWKLFRELGASNKSKSEENIVGINFDNELVPSNLETANAFKKYFANVASKTKRANL